MFRNEPKFTEMIECRFAPCYHLRKPGLSRHKHEYVTKEVENSVKMISQEVQFCLYLILAYSETSRCQFLGHRLPTYTCKNSSRRSRTVVAANPNCTPEAGDCPSGFCKCTYSLLTE